MRAWRIAEVVGWVLLMASLALMVLVLLFGCELETTNWQPELDLFDCASDLECLPDERCIADACRVPCYSDAECDGHCGEIAGTVGLGKVCWDD